MGSGLRRTLGEEYVEIGLGRKRKVEKTDHIYDSDTYKKEVERLGPQMFRKLAFVVFRALFPYLFKKLSHYRQKTVQNKEHKTATDFLPSLEELWEDVFSKVHLAIFLH
jgi:hypothetical protein